MKTIATYKVSLILDDEDKDVRAGYERMILDGSTIEVIDERFSNEFFELLSKLLKEESEECLEIKLEKFEDLPF